MGVGTLLSVERFLDLPDEPGKQELIDGELIEMPPAKRRHVTLSIRIADELRRIAAPDHVVVPEGGFRVDQEIFLQPDVAYASRAQIEGGNPDEHIAGPPELAIEVASPSNRADALEAKVRKYLANGSKEVWVVYPNSRSVWVFRGNPPAGQSHEDALTSDLFPGWSLSLADLFA